MKLSRHPAEPAERRVVLENVSWDHFEALLKDERAAPGTFAYVEGRLEIMSPSPKHEILKGRIGLLLEAYAQEMGIDILPTCSTTLKRQMKHRGVEPDESYYVQNESLVRGRTDLELERDPPPDLVLEIQLTRSALDKLDIYAAMEVPEVWLWESEKLRIYWRGRDQQRYIEHEHSRAFPALPISILLRFVTASKEKSTTRLANEFRVWVREHARGNG